MLKNKKDLRLHSLTTKVYCWSFRTSSFMTPVRCMMVIILIIFSFFSNAQEPIGKNDTTNIYKLYRHQLSDLFRNRGYPPQEIIRLVQLYEGYNILTDGDIANLLGRLYPSNQGIGILFYFFDKDSLHRLFFEPGKIIEHKPIFITKEKLLQLSIDFNHALGLYTVNNDRMPHKRGLIVNAPPGKSAQTLETVTKNATQLLLPTSFNDQYKHLVIIPALNIGTIPFHLLKPYQDNDYLIDKCSFTIAPSLADVFGMRIRILKELDGVNFYDAYSHTDSVDFTLENPLFISNPAYPQGGDFIFPDLPGAQKEITDVIKYAETYKLLEGKNAVKDSVLKYLGKSDVAYFATHGIADENNPMEKSFLVLSGEKPYLTARDIMDFGKNDTLVQSFPQMVILSACQTGLGKAMEVGVAGLARSFLMRGSYFVIMSLWNVDDSATAYLMSRFIFHLTQRNRFTPAEPLRQAILDTKKVFPKPSQWASFSVFGTDY